MRAGRLDLKDNLAIEQGSLFSIVATWKDDAGVVINITGYIARMQLRHDYSSAAAVVDINESDNSHGQLILGGVAGTINIKIHDEHTATLDPGRYVYDLEMKASGGDWVRLLEGVAEVVAEVTR